MKAGGKGRCVIARPDPDFDPDLCNIHEGRVGS